MAISVPVLISKTARNWSRGILEPMTLCLSGLIGFRHSDGIGRKTAVDAGIVQKDIAAVEMRHIHGIMSIIGHCCAIRIIPVS